MAVRDVPNYLVHSKLVAAATDNLTPCISLQVMLATDTLAECEKQQYFSLKIFERCLVHSNNYNNKQWEMNSKVILIVLMGHVVKAIL